VGFGRLRNPKTQNLHKLKFCLFGCIKPDLERPSMFMMLLSRRLDDFVLLQVVSSTGFANRRKNTVGAGIYCWKPYLSAVDIVKNVQKMSLIGIWFYLNLFLQWRVIKNLHKLTLPPSHRVVFSPCLKECKKRASVTKKRRSNISMLLSLAGSSVSPSSYLVSFWKFCWSLSFGFS